MLGKGAVEYSTAFCNGLRPEPILMVSEWADRFRMLSSVASAEPGQWRTSRAPYLKEIMDALSPSNPAQDVVVMKGAQLGFTEAGNCWIGYVIDHAPGPMLAVQPTMDMAKRNTKTRIDPLIEETPRLREKIKPARSRDSGNTQTQKDFPGGTLVLAGANSASALRSMPARYLFLDEIDGYPGDVDGEGDPVELAVARTRTFARRKRYKVSTPTNEGTSRISALYQDSDQRRYHLPCPHCGHMQPLIWANLKWEKGKPDTAEYACAGCGVMIAEHHKAYMLANGRWVPDNPGHAVRGYHISSLYSPLGWFSWADAASQWERGQELRGANKTQALKVFVNTVLGETWRDAGEAPEWERLYKDNREEYLQGTVPMGGLFLTAGVDVQENRLECEVVAWGRHQQSWSIDYIVIPGNTADPATWKKLDDELMRSFKHEGGTLLQISKLAVDSGYNTQHVYNWVRNHPIDRVLAVKGRDDLQLMVGMPHSVDVTTAGKKVRRGVRLWPVGSSVIKRELYANLKQKAPLNPGDPYPNGHCHFPQYDEDYFKQLSAEQIVVRVVKGYTRYNWEKTQERNEALDCRVYARAAAAVVGLDRYSEEHWREFEAALGIAAKVDEEQKDVEPVVDSGSTKPRRSFI